MSEQRRPVIVVSVGTDHHRFDRLIDWITQWEGAHSVDLRVQHGSSRPVPGARNAALVSHSELLQWMIEADGVLVQGGPGGMFDALRSGHRPLVVPRVSSLGEHVDDHQVAFTRRMAAHGYVSEVTSSAELAAHLSAVQPKTHASIDLTQSLEARGPQEIAKRLSAPPERIRALSAGRRLTQVLLAGRQPPASESESPFPRPRSGQPQPELSDTTFPFIGAATGVTPQVAN